MDSLIVDLDKVLDDFEAEEKASSQLPGQETRPSDFAQYVALKEDRPWEELNQAPVSNDTTWKLYPSQDHKLTPGGYDDPYIPVENFDLSEADFAPSVIAHEKSFLKIGNCADETLNNHFDKESTENTYQNSLQKINNIKKGNYVLESNGSQVLPKIPNDNNFQYISVSNNMLDHKQQNGTIDHEDVPCDITVTKNQTNQKYSRPSTIDTFSLHSPDAKFPIQARDEFTPVYENQPFPPDLAPAILGGSSLNGSLNVIPEYSFKSEEGRNSMDSDRTASDNSYTGSESSETLPKTLMQNSQLDSQASSLNSVSEERSGSDASVNKSTASQPPSQKENEQEGQGDNIPVQDNFTEPPSPQYVLNTSEADNMDTVADIGTTEHSNDLQNLGAKSVAETPMTLYQSVATISETEALGGKSSTDTTAAVSVTESKQEAENTVVGFNDMNSDMAENDLENYLEDMTLDTVTAHTSRHQGDHESSQYDRMRDGSPLQYGSMDSFTTSTKQIVSDIPQEIAPDLASIIVSKQDSLPSYDQLHPSALAPSSSDNSLEGYTSSTFQSETTVLEQNESISDSTQSKINGSNVKDLINEQRPLSNVDVSSGGARPKELTKQSVDTTQTQDEAGSDQMSAGLVSQQPTVVSGELVCSEIERDGHETLDVDLSGIQVYPREGKSELTQADEEMDEDLAAAIALSLKDMENSEANRIPQSDSSSSTTDNTEAKLNQNSGTQSHEALENASDQHRKRPNSLNLPPRGEDGSVSAERSHAPYTFPYPANKESSDADLSDTPENTAVPEVVEDATAAQHIQDNMTGAVGTDTQQDASLPATPPPSYAHSTLGKIAPTWIPDAEASNCMGCELKFTFTKRRHHCRACGRVFCSACCNMKSRLQYMENKEARVCRPCHEEMTIAEISSRTGRGPHPNNPSDYCSTIPISQQVTPMSPPTVMVPVGVLKREGSQKKSEPKHVMFSDGICPGGDLTELDGSSEASSRLPPRRSGRGQKKVEKDSRTHAVSRKLKSSENKAVQCLIPETGLPPVVLSTDPKGEYTLDSKPESEKYMQQIKDEGADPVVFALNSNLLVLVKIISLDCCVNRVCWCFTSKGMCNVGQDEIVIVLETLPNETEIPRDIFCHFHTVYEEAGKGNTVSDMGHSIFNQSFLDSRDHGGFLYIRPTFQCLHKLILPTPPYVFGILLQKWETPWAKVFPIRLMLRLGAEYRYYPCPLISVRNRKPVFFEIGHTIMNLLADFRNYQYMLPQIKGVSIHMEDKKTCINFPRNRYDDLMKVVTNSNEHVMAIGACFSTEADSHLVCIQNDEGNYQTQAINIQNKPRKVTGASFVVFNGALKTSSGLKAKSSIVEDGLMVQITPESMSALKTAMREMKEYTIECGSITATTPDEVVEVRWVREDKNVNIGVKSPIDGMAMDGVESLHIPNATDYVGEHKSIRWTDVFFIQNLDSGSSRWEPVDLSKLADTLSNATCLALTPHLDKLREVAHTKIGLRVTIESEKVGYEIGSNGERLPDVYMNRLDDELIPVIHSAASQNQGGSIILELVFHVLD